MADSWIKSRVFVGGDLDGGAVLALDAGPAHHLTHVLRLKAGDGVAVFNGRDGEWHARIDGIRKASCSVVVETQLRPQSREPDLWLLFAPIKRVPINFLAQKATELGVSALWPVITAHTQIARVNTARLQANAIEAAQQCERLGVPEIFQPKPLAEVMDTWPRSRRILWCDESGGGEPIAAALSGLREGGDTAIPRAVPWAVLIGPEGGFAATELDGLRKLPFVTPVTLGPRVMRADTAALAALACWQAVLGDWQTNQRKTRSAKS
ncbi:MAG: 16S rRNA (uracil(1498)-N(3))-methyltransferase [Alphaproteobacteria bacterium]